MAWTEPKDFEVGENLTATTMNEQVSENMRALYAPARDIINIRNGTNITVVSQTSGNFIAVDDNQFTLTVDTTGRDLLIVLNIVARPATNNLPIIFDFYVDDSYYVSSGSSTPLDDGLYSDDNNAGWDIHGNITWILEDVEAGTHTIKLRHSCRSAATIVLEDIATQFSVIEI